jgi:hypothetical protein
MSAYEARIKVTRGQSPALAPSRFEFLEECILSGQLSDSELGTLLRRDPALARWLSARAAKCVDPTVRWQVPSSS